MAEIVLFHHAQGLTEGVVALAETLRGSGHTVHLPDLYGGQVFATLDEGMAYVQQTGFETLIDRGVTATDGLGEGLVYAGISLGVLPAQKLAQTRAGARGALLLEACVPVSEFSDRWPASVPVQVHGMADDPSFGPEDRPAAEALVAEAADAELFIYPGEVHLFTDASLPDHDAAATALLLERVQAFLARV